MLYSTQELLFCYVHEATHSTVIVSTVMQWVMNRRKGVIGQFVNECWDVQKINFTCSYCNDVMMQVHRFMYTTVHMLRFTLKMQIVVGGVRGVATQPHQYHIIDRTIILLTYSCASRLLEGDSFLTMV